MQDTNGDGRKDTITAVHEEVLGAARAEVVPANYANTSWRNVVASAAGPACAAVFTNPMDVAKTRMQLSGELTKRGEPRAYNNMFDCMAKTYKNEGLQGLQRGLSCSVVREASKCSFRLGLYQPILLRLHTEPGAAPLYKRLVAAGCAGGTSAVICNPVDVLKTVLQADCKVDVKTMKASPAKYRGMLHCLSSLAKEQGVASMWKGTPVSVGRSILANVAALPTKTYLAEYLDEHKLIASDTYAGQVMQSTITGFTAGCAAVAAMNPLDVVRTRLYNQPIGPNGKGALYDGAADAARKIVSIEGVTALYKGAIPNMVRTGPHYMFTFIFIDLFRRLLRDMKSRKVEQQWVTTQQAAFSELDTDASGSLDRQQVKHAVQLVIPRQALADAHHTGDRSDEYDKFVANTVDKLFKTADLDGNGSIEFNEFCGLCEEIRTEAFEVRTEILFHALDCDHSGNLSPDNIFAAVRHKTSTALDSVHDTSHTSQDDARLRGAITAMIQAADDNQDGVIGLDEFKELMRSHRGERAFKSMDDALLVWSQDAGVGLND